MILRTATAVLLVSVLAGGVVGTAHSAANPEANKPSYWGNNCVKTEMNGEVMKYNAPAGATKVVVKGGTGNVVYTTAPFTNLTAPINPKNGKTYGISHVIVCTDTKPEQVTPVNNTKPVKPTKPVETPAEKPRPAKGGADVTPVTVQPAATVKVVDTLATPAVLPEVGIRANLVAIVAAAAVVMGYLAHRRVTMQRLV